MNLIIMYSLNIKGILCKINGSACLYGIKFNMVERSFDRVTEEKRAIG